MRRQNVFAARAVALFSPIALTIFAVGCPKKGSDGKESAASTSVSIAPSAAPSPSAPRTIVVPVATIEPDASMLDFEGDALADFGDGGEASEGGDADARIFSDAPVDAALMGTVTFAEETPVRGMRRITSGAARVHKAPKDGTTIATLPKGTEVWLVAEFTDWYRVKYVDPNTQIARQGWIYIVNIAGPRQKTCPSGWTYHDQEGGWCDRECKRNTDCKAIKGYKCSGDRCFYAAD